MSYHRSVPAKDMLGVIIEDDVRIAGHVMTLPGAKIGEGAIVGAYSLVTRNVRPYTFVYGIPTEEHDDKNGLLKQAILPKFKRNSSS
jgi:acetyltransferase-like isoleucine patch superfamily enzyme